MIRPAVLLSLLLITTSAAAAEFRSDFGGQADRVWVGGDYWANPMEDWSITGGRLECRGGGNRNVALLTCETTRDAEFEISVKTGRIAKGAGPGSVGFRLGVRDEIADYRAAALRGKGLDVGVDNVTGRLFIGRVRSDEAVGRAHWKEFRLRLNSTTTGETAALILQAEVAEREVLARVEATVPVDQVRGLVALVNNHNSAHKPAFWFSEWKLTGAGVKKHGDRAWGPILWTMHTLDHSLGRAGMVLKMTVQLAPNETVDPDLAKLSLDGRSDPLQARVDELSRTAVFRIENWDASKRSAYVVHYGDARYEGEIRAEPAGRPLVVAGFTGNTDYLFPNNAVVRNVTAQDPDLLFFSGDQIYEGVGGYGVLRAPTDTADETMIKRSTLNYLRKWHLFGWAFGPLMRDRPTICLPDDHDVYQGNIWGEGGRNAHGMRNHARGGFAQHPKFVNAVIRSQCGHHPDLPDPEPMMQGIHVFFGSMLYGGVSFSILEDRYFKSGPQGKVDSWKGRPDHVKRAEFDTASLDQRGLELLGARQEKFLQSWAADWRGADFKCVLSQTIFNNLANYHGPRQEFIFADLDSNGWPQTPRNRALRILRSGYAFHFAGDQHLPSLTQYGVDDWRDAGFAFCVPSIAAGYPRSWLPDKEGRKVQNRPPPGLANTGDYRDGLGNFVTVFGVGNPRQKNRPGRENTAHDKSSGHGVVRFDRSDLTITAECYRVQIDPRRAVPEDQFPGWPKTIKLRDNRGQSVFRYLPEIAAPKGVKRPVLRLTQAATGRLVYALRLAGPRIRPWVYAPGVYRVELGDPDADSWTVVEHISVDADHAEKPSKRD